MRPAAPMPISAPVRQPREERHHGICPVRQHRPAGLAPVPGLHDLWRPRLARMGPGRGGGPAVHPRGLGGRDQLLRHRRHVQPGRAARTILGRAIKELARRDEVVIATKLFNADGPAAEPEGPVAQARHGRHRRLAQAARHRLCRPPDHPPLRSRHADRGDGRGPLGRGQGRQGALSRRLLDVGLAVHEDAGHPARPRPRPLRLDAELPQPGLPRGGARDAAPCAGPRASR